MAGGSGVHIQMQNCTHRVTLHQTHTRDIHRDLHVQTEAGLYTQV